jgi:hypothetical protein
MPPKAALVKIREALNSHLNSWRRKHDLSPATAREILKLHLYQEDKKAAPKPLKPKKKQTVPRPQVIQYASSDDEHAAQVQEGRARAAQED